jgi:putative membrane protein
MLFMLCELFPWSFPVALRPVSRKLVSSGPFATDQKKLVATVVHNAGIYNGIVASGLLWAAFGASSDVALIMLAGAVVAGIFGTATLRSPVSATQAVVGMIGLILLWIL